MFRLGIGTTTKYSILAKIVYDCSITSSKSCCGRGRPTIINSTGSNHSDDLRNRDGKAVKLRTECER